MKIDITKATPRPWTFEPPWSGFSAIRGPKNELIFGIAAGVSDEKQHDDVCHANALMIFRAVNAHDKLVEALLATCKLLTLHTGPDDAIAQAVLDLADAALTLAEGKP